MDEKKGQAFGYLFPIKTEDIHTQKTAILQHCADNNLRLRRVFVDDASRTELIRMFSALEENTPVKFIVLPNDAALSDDPFRAEFIKVRLEGFGIKIELINQTPPKENPFRDFLMKFMTIQKEFDILKMKGKRALSPNYSGGCPGLPFVVSRTRQNPTPHLVVNPLQKKVAERIVWMRFEKNLSFGEISRKLNAERIPSYHGKCYYPQTVRLIALKYQKKGSI